MNDLLTSIILGIVEGLTEFLPISSTGHLIILNEFLDYTGSFAKTFDIVIQSGAILAVIVYFRSVLSPFRCNAAEGKSNATEIWKKALTGFTPALVVGALFGQTMEESLFNPLVVASALIAGGLILLLVDRAKIKPKINSMDSLGYKTAFAIGLFQCLSMIPGTSRSAATIVGALLLGVSRPVAVEYSFFLAVPTMTAAAAYSLAKTGLYLTAHQIILLAAGFTTSFAVAFLTIAGFIKYVSKRDFTIFGIYRVILGLAVLSLLL